MISLTIDSREVKVEPGSTVLEAARENGISIPTLCYHEALEPYAACRICLVELEGPGGSKLVPSCAYPCEEGLVVYTHSDMVLRSRRMTIELLMSSAAHIPLIHALAEELGVTEVRYTQEPNDCILCGLCVRVCREAIGAAAIGFIGRGAEREVGSPFRVQSEACIGCGACAEVCPTGAVQMEDVGDKRILHTWNTTVTLHACPECGGFFAPEPTAFLKEMLPEIAQLWALCPQCRRQKALQQAPGVAAPLASRE
jgi:bidirectional [NiFe] hydrogenase diaphorase subunit